MTHLRLLVASAALAALLGPELALAEEAAEARKDPALAPFLRYPLFPEHTRSSGLIFSHKFHRKKKADCSDCHADIEEARTTEQSLRPAEAVCFECHEESERENCETCHEGRPRAAKRPESEIVFDHAAHMQREGVECETCHAGVKNSESAEDTFMPAMSVCTSCHEHEEDMNRLNCSRCHARLPEKAAMPQDEAMHGAGFFALHGAWASGGSARCSQCHEQSFCADCHAAATQPLPPSQLMPERVDRSFIHRGDFLSRHALEASARPATCVQCHGTSFCRDCHDDRFRAQGGSAGNSPHPAGYVMRGGVAFHGTDVRQNPYACAACHDQGAASNCVDCHRVGAPGGNPHPPGWERRGREDEKKSSGACVPCHAGGN